jgi:hypothetical protein
LPDGSQVAAASTVGGYLEIHDVEAVGGEIQVSSGMTPRDYDLAMLSSVAGSAGVKLS